MKMTRTSHCRGPGARRRPLSRTAGRVAASNRRPAIRATLPNGSPKSREYSQGIANANTSSSTRIARRMGLKPLRVDQARINADPGCRLDGRFNRAVVEILGHGVGHKEDVLSEDGLVGIAAPQH